MKRSFLSKYRLLITIFIVCTFVVLLIIYPMIVFHKNEAKLVEAAKRYYELNSDRLPTGERVKTLSLKALYNESYIKEDLRVPYSRKVCSLDNSWVKVTKKNGEYKYYSYLDCGILRSSVDHKGPTIKLNGDLDVVVNVGEKYKDPGIKSIVDNSDGKMKMEDVTVKSNVDTSKVGSYEIKYYAYDSLNNKSEVIRNISVVKKIKETVVKELGSDKYYKGLDPNNYIYFSNVLFRILKVDGDNIVIVAADDVSFVDYDSINKWFKYYDSNLTDSSKKIIVKNKYCNMVANDNKLNSTSCDSYSGKSNYGLLSIDDINNTLIDENSYLVGGSISWTANSKDDKNAYAYRNIFSYSDSIYYSFEKKHNFGVRPVITIKGDTLVIDGDGSDEKPYVLTDFVKLKKNTSLSSRYVGEYVRYSGYLWRIQRIESDGTVKVICNHTLREESENIKINYDDSLKNKIYDTKTRGNVGYKINNITSKHVDTSYFVNHSDYAYIYKNEPMYDKEVNKNKIDSKIFAPNMYEMYSASSSGPYIKSYWLINSSKSANEVPGVSDTGTVMYGEGSVNYSYGIRPVAYFNKKIVVTSGKGTINEPFMIKK